MDRTRPIRDQTTSNQSRIQRVGTEQSPEEQDIDQNRFEETITYQTEMKYTRTDQNRAGQTKQTKGTKNRPERHAKLQKSKED